MEKKENGEFKINNEIDDNKTLKELIDNIIINIKKLIEIIPSDDPNNITKIRLKKEQEKEDEKDEEDIGKKEVINKEDFNEIKKKNDDVNDINLEEEIDDGNKKNTKKNKKKGSKQKKKKNLNEKIKGANIINKL